MAEERSKNVGCIVGRFQVPELSASHVSLIQEVQRKHPKTAIVLCSQGCKNRDSYNPLDFTMRQQMIRSVFPDITICPLKDHFSDDKWSENLDDVLSTTFSTERITIYGKQETVVNRYSGRFQAVSLDSCEGINGAAIRNETGMEIVNSVDFRKGIIYTTLNKFPSVYPTVDIAVVQDVLGVKNILLGKKPIDLLWRLPGGFANNKEPYEVSAVREIQEEANLQVSRQNLKYVGSFPINDWRYQHEDTITTTLFTVEIGLDSPPVKAGDDLAFVRWFPLNRETLEEKVQEPHKVLVEAVLNFYNL